MASSVATKILIIGCGDLGAAVAQQLVQSGVYAIGVRRSTVVIDGVLIIQADVTQPYTLDSLRAIQPEIVV
ncbi:MAG: NAD-binding protein, partial [Methylotenera sp.]|nr:NAD-binding protein [Methylotenera sp.]